MDNNDGKKYLNVFFIRLSFFPLYQFFCLSVRNFVIFIYYLLLSLSLLLHRLYDNNVNRIIIIHSFNVSMIKYHIWCDDNNILEWIFSIYPQIKLLSLKNYCWNFFFSLNGCFKANCLNVVVMNCISHSIIWIMNEKMMIENKKSFVKESFLSIIIIMMKYGAR